VGVFVCIYLKIENSKYLSSGVFPMHSIGGLAPLQSAGNWSGAWVAAWRAAKHHEHHCRTAGPSLIFRTPSHGKNANEIIQCLCELPRHQNLAGSINAGLLVHHHAQTRSQPIAHRF
jgi:hypothetical protein